MQDKTTHFAAQINQAQKRAMRQDPNMICMGLGINDPKNIFGTTQGLEDEFGSHRVFDMPTSENAMTGVGIGAAIAGTRVLMTHQRVDFFLLALDQLVNNAAKWHYMFNGQMSVPLTLRLIIGRGWGQGPTHQQSLQSWFAHIPGLKVITPGLTDNVGQLLYQSIMDNNPTVFLEHRWLHNQEVSESKLVSFQNQIETTRIIREGTDITLIANSYMLLEAVHASNQMLKQGVSCEIIEIACSSDINWSTIYKSVNKTNYCLITDIGHLSFSVSSEVAARVSEHCFTQLKKPPVRLGLPDIPEPTSFGLTTNFYNGQKEIIDAVSDVLATNIRHTEQKQFPHDVPGSWFKGPF